MKKPVYLDYNATTPLHPEVISAIKPFLEEHFGNPSSNHPYGFVAKEAVEKARSQVAGLLNCDPEEVVFTSGGTEANNFALKGVAYALRHRGNHLITSQIEHPAVLEVCRFLEQVGFHVTYLPVDHYGLVDPEAVKKAITPQTILISIMHANNEVGTLQPIEEIGKIAKTYGVLFHTDAAQTVGKIPVDVQQLGVDLLSVAGHKLYAPKGIGGLYIRKGVTLPPLHHGAGHERGRRAGTENVMGIVGLGKACEIAKQEMKETQTLLQEMRDRLHQGLAEKVQEVKLNGHPENRLPNTLNLSFRGIEAHLLQEEIKEEVALSTGSACHSGDPEISPVLKAMGVPPEWGRGTLRFSTGRWTTKEEIDYAIQVVTETLQKAQGNR